MKAETCCCHIPLINYILCNKFVLDYKCIYISVNHWRHYGDASPKNSITEFNIYFIFYSSQFYIFQLRFAFICWIYARIPYIFYPLFHNINFMLPDVATLTLTLLTWRMWWTATSASKWQMGFNSAFKGLIMFGEMYKLFISSCGFLHLSLLSLSCSQIFSPVLVYQVYYVFILSLMWFYQFFYPIQTKCKIQLLLLERLR